MDSEHKTIVSFLALFPTIASHISLFKDNSEEEIVAFLHNGVILFDALSYIAPFYFDSSSIVRDPKDNYILKQSNVSKLLKVLQRYLRHEQGKKILWPKTDDAQYLISTIATNPRWDNILFLLELVAATAVKSEKKEIIVKGIRTMSKDDQRILKDLIERGKAHLQECEKGDDELLDDQSLSLKEGATIGIQSSPFYHRGSLSGGGGEDLTLDTESDFAEPCDEVLSPSIYTFEEHEEYATLTKGSLFMERNQLRKKLEESQKENTHLKRQLESFDSDTKNAQEKLIANAGDLHDRLTDREDELNKLYAELALTKRAKEDAESKLADKEEECKKLADDVDELKDNTTKLAGLQIQNAKLKERLTKAEEENNRNPTLVYELEIREKEIEQLKEDNKTFSEVSKSMEELQRKFTRAEKDKEELNESLNQKNSEILKLKAKLKDAENAKRKYESDFKDLISQNEQEETLDSELKPMVNGIQPHVISTDLMRQMERMELENITLKQQLEEIQKQGLAIHDEVATVQDIQSLLQEINELNEIIDHMKEDREKIREERDKLITVITELKKKYVADLKESNAKLKEQKDKIYDMESKMDSEKAAHKREEKLMSSAVYELGLTIMKRKLTERERY